MKKILLGAVPALVVIAAMASSKTWQHMHQSRQLAVAGVILALSYLVTLVISAAFRPKVVQRRSRPAARNEVW